jgi:hypothetical protein
LVQVAQNQSANMPSAVSSTFLVIALCLVAVNNASDVTIAQEDERLYLVALADKALATSTAMVADANFDECDTFATGTFESSEHDPDNNDMPKVIRYNDDNTGRMLVGSPQPAYGTGFDLKTHLPGLDTDAYILQSSKCSVRGREVYTRIMSSAPGSTLGCPIVKRINTELAFIGKDTYDAGAITCAASGTLNIRAGGVVKLRTSLAAETAGQASQPDFWVFQSVTTLITGAIVDVQFVRYEWVPLTTKTDPTTGIESIDKLGYFVDPLIDNVDTVAAMSKNVFWVVGTSVTMGATTAGASSSMKGNLLAYAAITMGTGSNLQGFALAMSAGTCAGACKTCAKFQSDDLNPICYVLPIP